MTTGPADQASCPPDEARSRRRSLPRPSAPHPPHPHKRLAFSKDRGQWAEGPEIPGEQGLNWEGEAQPGTCRCCSPSPKAGPACLPRQGPAGRDLGHRHQRRQAAPRRARQAGAWRATTSWSLRAGAPSTPAPPRVKAACQWGLPRDPLPGRCHLGALSCYGGCPLSERPLQGAHAGPQADVSEYSQGPPCLPQRCPMCVDMGTPSPDPQHTHRHPRGQPVHQTAAPEGLGTPCPPPLTYGQDVRVLGSLAGRVACLTPQNRAVTCDPDTLPCAQQAGQRLPPGEWVPGREGPAGGAAGGLGATFPAAQTPRCLGRKLIQPFYPSGQPRQTAAHGLHTGARMHWEQPPGMAEPGPQDIPILRLRNHDRVPPRERTLQVGLRGGPRGPTVPTWGLVRGSPEGQRRNQAPGEGASGCRHLQELEEAKKGPHGPAGCGL